MPSMQLPLWEPSSDWKAPRLADLPSWEGVKRLGLDTETNDQHLKQLGIGVRRGGYVAGVSFAFEDGPEHYYLPIAHEGGGNVEGDVWGYLRENAAKFKGDVVGANLPYELDYLWENDVHFHDDARYRDIQVADPLIYELHQSYSLDNIAKRHGLPGKDEDLLREAAADYGVDPKKSMWRLPPRFVGRYAEADVRQPLLTLRRQERLIDDKDLWDVWNMECDVLPVLVRMRRRGVRVDFDKLEQVEHWSLTQEAEALAYVKRETGVDIGVNNVWKGERLAQALNALGYELPKTATGKSSVDRDVLGDIDHPVAKKLTWARKVNKLRTTFAASVRKYETNGRIHCTFNQIAREDEKGEQKGVRYGRLSAVDPNLQQQPNPEKDPALAGEWRKVYIPEEGALWSCNDYSQQEPRWTTHFAAVMGLPGAREAAQAYHDDPDMDNHTFMAEITGLPRPHAKQIYLGVCYGEGGAKLCRELGLPTRWALAYGRGRERRVQHYPDREAALDAKRQLTADGYVWEAAGEEGQNILDTFDDRAPYIRMLAKEARTRGAEQRGYVKTIAGRRLHFPERADGSFDWTHKALNRIIQGSGADQTKKAIVEIDRAGHWLALQVHDEVDVSVTDHREAFRVSEIMRDVVTAEVPFRVDTEVGPSWGEIEKLAA